MLDEKVQKGPHVEQRKSQEQYQKIISKKTGKVPTAEHARGD
jgi:hypothetical protein